MSFTLYSWQDRQLRIDRYCDTPSAWVPKTWRSSGLLPKSKHLTRPSSSCRNTFLAWRRIPASPRSHRPVILSSQDERFGDPYGAKNTRDVVTSTSADYREHAPMMEFQPRTWTFWKRRHLAPRQADCGRDDGSQVPARRSQL